MNDKLRESLSALMDNEGDELELRRALKSLDDSPETADVWRRYHLARSLMQRDRDIETQADLSAGIMARIADEPVPAPGEFVAVRRKGGLSFAGSAAVAATVSVLVISGVQVYNGFDPATPDDLASQAPSGSGAATNRSGVSLASSTLDADTPTSLPPLYPAFGGGDGGVMTVGADLGMPMLMAPNQRQSLRSDVEQARLLQTYLERHAQGAAYRSGEPWMPLLRASALEPMSPR
ncbi:sigma-E factor negative regulatory protein [Halomonas sp. HP20-15]|uniref:sigma-E factor negative regulatory protein n=1 Tax=Halomonas sp. HP20-15 TaxID=3085901 RepID=UPI002981E7E5|nr:sigma-E factor negative regulatory protein [Halomonas sp. HP20-15]MDW5375744.1 sigma-E factor negative regulatory protein [Halomonas sp. HP20-15]